MSASDRRTDRVGVDGPGSPISQGSGAISGADSLSTSRTPTRRVGRRALVAMRAQLSQRDLDVLRSIKQFRLIQIHQLQRLHFGGHASEASGARVARRVLKRLHGLDLVHRLDRRIGGIRAGSAGHIYALSPNGHRLLGTSTRKRRSEPALGFVTHTCAIAELGSLVVKHSRNRRFVLLELQTEPECWRADQRVKPDLHLVVANRRTELSWFVELDCGTESSRTIERKCQTYDDYRASGAEQRINTVFPKVLWVAPDEHRAGHIRSAANQVNARLFDVVTFDRALDHLTDFGGSR